MRPSPRRRDGRRRAVAVRGAVPVPCRRSRGDRCGVHQRRADRRRILPEFFHDVDLYVDGLDFFAFEAREQVFKYCAEHRIPAVTVTGYSAPDDVDRALAAGYQMHLPKPVDPVALIEAVAKLSRESA